MRTVPVRGDVVVLASNAHAMVPELLPLEPAVIFSQLLPEATCATQFIVPVPVLDTLNVVVPDIDATPRLPGFTVSTDCDALTCVTVTSTGLPDAPDAVIRMAPVLDEVLVLAVKLQLMVPELVPLAPDVIDNQLLPDVTAADQGMVPVPVLETLNVVVPVSFATSRLDGLTESTSAGSGDGPGPGPGPGAGAGAGVPACVTVTSVGVPVAPVAVTRIVPVRADMPVLALNEQVMVPVSVPLTPGVIESQLLPDITAAVQGMVPVPVLDRLNVVVPASFATSRLVGLTESTGCVVATISI